MEISSNFYNNEQGDCFEFMHSFLEILHEELIKDRNELDPVYFSEYIGSFKEIYTNFLVSLLIIYYLAKY